MANDADRYHVGTIVSGRYCVERPIGEGAMGTVALARHVSLDENVAIKFLRPELRRDPVAIARLSREGRALARIKSDHVTRVLDVGATLATGPYMVMEYLEGTDLHQVLEAEGPLPAERTVEIVLQICEAMTVAHTAGIVHRDIKPQNLFLARHGQFETLKVLDFGISEVLPSSSAEPVAPPAADKAASLYGTPAYMSPERIRNEPTADHRSDIWSIGVVLHELVTGRGVFDTPSVTETCARVLSSAPLGLEANDAVLPPSLRSIIGRCLERDPDRRYQSVAELAAALVPLATMTERFRGRSTGASSRPVLAEPLGASRAPGLPLGSLDSSSPAAGELSSALRNVGAALRSVLRAVPRLRVGDRPLWQHGSIVLASALTVLLAVSLGGNLRWVSAPSVTVRGEPLEPGERYAVRGLDDTSPAPQQPDAATSPAPPAEPAEAPPPAVEQPEPAAAVPEKTAGALEDERASLDRPVRSRAKTKRATTRRKRAAAKLPLALDDIPDEPTPHARRRRGSKRPARASVPEWLEATRSDPP